MHFPYVFVFCLTIINLFSFSLRDRGLLYINIALSPSPWTSRLSVNMRWDEESFTWLTHYPAQCCVPGGRLIQPLDPTVEGVWDPAFSVIQFCLDGQLRCSRTPRRPQLWRKGQGKVNLGVWLAAWGHDNNFLRLASSQASNELEPFNLYHNNLYCQLGLMTNFLWHFIQHPLWSSVNIWKCVYWKGFFFFFKFYLNAYFSKFD